MRTVIAALTVVLMLGTACKKEKGEKGDQGPRGPAGISGPSGQVPITILSGSVPNDDFPVFDSRITTASGILVYGGAGGELIQLPIFNTSGGYNVLYVISTGKVRIINAKSGGFTGYAIALVE